MQNPLTFVIEHNLITIFTCGERITQGICRRARGLGVHLRIMPPIGVGLQVTWE